MRRKERGRGAKRESERGEGKVEDSWPPKDDPRGLPLNQKPGDRPHANQIPEIPSTPSAFFPCIDGVPRFTTFEDCPGVWFGEYQNLLCYSVYGCSPEAPERQCRVA